jgi:hypothetical protein
MKIALAFSLLAATAVVEPLHLDGVYSLTTNDRDPVTFKPVCSETWHFADGNRLTVESGEEVVIETYRTEHDRDGHWLVTARVSTNGLADCMGERSTVVDASERRVLLLPFNSGELMICLPPTHTSEGVPLIRDCLASLRRKTG